MNRSASFESRLLVLVTLGLVAFGLVMVYSATSASAAIGHGNPTGYLERQSVYAALGLAAMWFFARTDYRALRHAAPHGERIRRDRVVDPADAAELAHELEPVRNAGEGAQRLGDRVVLDADGAGRRRRGRRVRTVVPAGNKRLGRKRIVGVGR